MFKPIAPTGRLNNLALPPEEDALPGLPVLPMDPNALAPAGPVDLAQLAPTAALNARIKQPGFLERINNTPAKKDALLAFAANMFGANSFREGLGTGLSAYAQRMQAHREAMKPKFSLTGNGEFTVKQTPDGISLSPNEEVIERTDQKAKIKQEYDLAKQQLRDEGFLKRMQQEWGHRFDIARLQIEAENGNAAAQRQLTLMIAQMTRDTQLQVAEMGIEARGTPLDRARANRRAEREVEYEDLVRGYEGNLANLDEIERLLPTSGAGTGVWRKALRGAANAFGIDVPGVDLSDNQRIQMLYRQLELQAAQALKGQGQVTEAERLILRQSVPSIDTDPEAVRTYIRTLRNVQQRHLQEYRSGQRTTAAPPRGAPASPNQGTTSTGIKWRRVQ